MALMDALLLFGESYDCDSETATLLFTNQIDLGAAGRDIGNGKQLYLNLVVTEAFTDGGDAATANFRLRSDDSATIHATTSSGHFETGTILKAALALGNKLSFPLPLHNTTPYERYLGLQCVVGTAGFDAGMVTAWISHEPVAGYKAYADAVN